MPEISRSSVHYAEPEIGPSYFAYHIREIEELFIQKEDSISSPASRNCISFGRTDANGEDNDIDKTHLESREAVGPSVSRSLFCNDVGDRLSDFNKERLKESIEHTVTVLGQEVDEILHSVFKMNKVKKVLENKEHVAEADRDVNQSPCKKQRYSSSPSSHSGTLGSQSYEGASRSEDLDSKDPNVVSSKGCHSDSRGPNKICVDCKTTSTPQWRWRDGPAGPERLCNACGVRLIKSRMSPLGFNKVEKKLKPELDKNMQTLLDIGGSFAKEAVKKFSDEFSGKLGHMEQQLEKYLDVITAKCRQMTKSEKQELQTLIQKLPPQNLDRVVDILVQHRNLPKGDPCDEIHIDLEKEDNVTLWRLYHYVEAVERAKNITEK